MHYWQALGRLALGRDPAQNTNTIQVHFVCPRNQHGNWLASTFILKAFALLFGVFLQLYR